MLRTKTSTILFQTVGWVLLLGLFLAFTAHRGDAMSTARVFRPAFLGFMAVYLFVFYGITIRHPLFLQGFLSNLGHYLPKDRLLFTGRILRSGRDHYRTA